MIRRRVVVSGAVQGVAFRDGCRSEASARGVTGWVANRDDGAVEAVFEGSPGEVVAMVAWSRRGPAHADVTDIRVHEEEPTGEVGYQIR